MIIRIRRTYRKEDWKVIMRSIRRKYGRLEKVKKIYHVKKCTRPEIGEAYLFYLAEGERIEEEVIIEDKRVFNALTTKRLELLEFLNSHPPMSIKELARLTSRDYKNVYDDISSLSRFMVVNLVKSGKEIVPVGKIEGIEVRI